MRARLMPLIVVFAATIAAVLLLVNAIHRVSGADATAVFSAVAPTVKATAAFTALLPTYLPDEGATVYAFIARNASTGYTVYVGFDPACKGNASCSLGYVSGSSAALPLTGTKTQLSNGATAYYSTGKCTAYCTPSTITWHAGNGYYQVGLRGGSQAELQSVANSMSNYR